MALARLSDPEQILYMQRNYRKLELKNQELSSEIRKLQRHTQLKEFYKLSGISGEQSQ